MRDTLSNLPAFQDLSGILIMNPTGAATQLFALTHPDARELSGVYFNHCCPCEPIPAATDFQNALELESLSQN